MVATIMRMVGMTKATAIQKCHTGAAASNDMYPMLRRSSRHAELWAGWRSGGLHAAGSHR